MSVKFKIGRNDPCWCKSGKKYKACHQAFDEKIAMFASKGHIVPQHDIIKNAEQIAGIKESCKINIAVYEPSIGTKFPVSTKTLASNTVNTMDNTF